MADNEFIQAPEGAAGNPIVLAILNWILPGVGNMVLGQKEKGIYLLFVAILITVLFCFPIIGPVTMIIPNLLLRIIFCIDIFKMGTKAQTAGQIGRGECFHNIAAGLCGPIKSKVNIFVEGA